MRLSGFSNPIFKNGIGEFDDHAAAFAHEMLMVPAVRYDFIMRMLFVKIHFPYNAGFFKIADRTIDRGSAHAGLLPADKSGQFFDVKMLRPIEYVFHDRTALRGAEKAVGSKVCVKMHGKVLDCFFRRHHIPRIKLRFSLKYTIPSFFFQAF